MSIELQETDLTLPPGIAADFVANVQGPDGPPEGLRELGSGLLVREHGPGEVCGFAKDHIKVLTRGERAEALADPNRVLLSKRVWSLFNQAQNGSCASESENGNFQLAREHQGQERIKFNPLFTYRHVNGGSDRGSSLDANLKFGRERGHCPMAVWPRDKGWRAKPSDHAYETAKNFLGDEFFEVGSLDEFKTLLLSGIPVNYGYRGHAITAVELINEDWFWYHNSWGNWGEKPYDDCKVTGFGRAKTSSIYRPYGMYTFLTTSDTSGLVGHVLKQAV